MRDTCGFGDTLDLRCTLASSATCIEMIGLVMYLAFGALRSLLGQPDRKGFASQKM